MSQSNENTMRIFRLCQAVFGDIEVLGTLTEDERNEVIRLVTEADKIVQTAKRAVKKGKA